MALDEVDDDFGESARMCQRQVVARAIDDHVLRLREPLQHQLSDLSEPLPAVNAAHVESGPVDSVCRGGIGISRQRGREIGREEGVGVTLDRPNHTGQLRLEVVSPVRHGPQLERVGSAVIFRLIVFWG